MLLILVAIVTVSGNDTLNFSFPGLRWSPDIPSRRLMLVGPSLHNISILIELSNFTKRRSRKPTRVGNHLKNLNHGSLSNTLQLYA